MTHPALLTHRMHLRHPEQAGILSPGSLPIAYLPDLSMRCPYLLTFCAWHMLELGLLDGVLACKH